MKKAFLMSLFAVPALLPAVASAESYGTPGQLEAGGMLAILSETETIKPDGGDEVESSLTGILVDPQVGYFISDGVQLIGGLHMLSFSQKVGDEDPASVTEIGLTAGGAYLIKVGQEARVGPQLLLRFGSNSLKATIEGVGEITSDEQRLGAQAGAFAKVPIGGGGVIAAGLAFDFSNVSQVLEAKDIDVKFEPKGTETSIGARVGYFVFF